MEALQKKKVVIAGAGFAGIQLARNLDKSLFEVYLIDKLNHHQFQPLFYQVGTSQLEPSSISFPLRHIFRKHPHVHIRMAEVLAVSTEKNLLHTSAGDFSFDYLVLAMGCTNNFYGNTEVEKHAQTLKTTHEAIALRNHVLEVFEKITFADASEKEALMNLVIAGAGPTGVELAGAFAEIKKNVLPADFPDMDFSQLKIILLDGSPNTLNSMSENAREKSAGFLRSLGVDLKLNTLVKSYDGKLLQLSNGENIPTRTLIWAAGVTPNRLSGIPASSVLPNGRIQVNRFSVIQGTTNTYALGDMAWMETPRYPKGHPQLANVAINQAKNLAANLKALQKNKKLKEYEYRDLGSMATIGTNKAVVDLPFAKFSGFFAWLIWMFLHLMLILSVKNKLIIFINWAWAYVTRNSSLRLILKGK
jgi:NADH dehydrogenase